MPKLPVKISPTQAKGLLRFWKEIRAVSINDIAAEAALPFSLALIGPEDQTKMLAARLAQESPVPTDGPHGPADLGGRVTFHAHAREVPGGSLQLDCETLAANEAELAQAIARIVVAHPDLRLSLARHLPAFRPAVTAQLVAETSWTNAKIATLSALPGVVPLAGILLPSAAAGDMILLTKNQGLMLLRIAAAYGLPIDLRARTRELLPVVGSAFGWRALARELLGLIPGGFGVVLKGSVAYAGTYTVGKAAQIYYSTGQTLSGPRLQKLGRDAAKEARVRLRRWLGRDKATKPREGMIGPSPSDPLGRDLPSPSVTRERGLVVSPLDGDLPDSTAMALDNPVKIGV